MAQGAPPPDRQQHRISFAANLQPLVVAEVDQHNSSGQQLFRTCALIAATPHAPINRKLVTDRCSSHLIPRPRSSSLAATATAAAGPGAPAQHGLARGPLQQHNYPIRCTTAPQPTLSSSPLAARQHHRFAAAVPRPGTSAAGTSAGAAGWGIRAATHSAQPAGHSRCSNVAASGGVAAVPAVLQFEGWWWRLGPGRNSKCTVHITYHTDTEPAAFFVRCEEESSSSSSSNSSSSTQDPNQGATTSGCSCSAAGATCSRSAGHKHHRPATAPAGVVAAGSRTTLHAELPPQGAWMCVTGASGEPLEQWDLHVGAELCLLGRAVTLRRATCSTMAWLDAWTRLLLKQKLSLEQQLSYFTTVRPTEGLVRHPERSDWSTPGVPSVPTGGKVNLRHLRESVALLSARLRQHTAAVRLTRELQDLTPQGPTCWALDDLPQVVLDEPFTPSAKHSAGGQLLSREFSRKGAVKRLPSLGRTPAGDRPPNLGHLLGWLQGIPLAASAAKDPYHHHNDHLQRYAAELQGPFGVGY